MSDSPRPKVLLLAGPDKWPLGTVLQRKCERKGIAVSYLPSGDTIACIDIVKQAEVDLIVLFCAEVYCEETCDWRITAQEVSVLESKADSVNARTPTIVIVTSASPETLARLKSCHVTQVVDLEEIPTAQHLWSVVLRCLAVGRSGLAA